MKLKDKVILITGGASPIGQAIALRMAREGARLALSCCHGKERAETFCTALKKTGARVELFEADLSEPKAPHVLIRGVTRHFSRLDGLINNASTFPIQKLENLNPEDWDRVLACNARGPFFLIREAAPWLRRVDGSVINITDAYARHPAIKDRIPYAVSKAALSAATKACADAFAPEIRVNAVAPGAITFPITYSEETKDRIRKKIPLGREGAPTDVAEAVMFLLTDAQYLTGETISVDGGRFM